MASTKDYLEYVLDLLRETGGITYKKMMGEYLLYKDGILFGGVYDDRFLVKKTPEGEKRGLTEQIPYPGAKPMFSVDDDAPEEVARLIETIVREIK